ncbi:hypothetical protein [Proteus mirabilis]|uniref:hypothetical protein n=1 Tax=Proteus mirabilis TaxID=584 RepID=UPI000666AD86|nr:hypothetical protein [Proteus mirabilis]AUU35443.1 hypothetical protein MC72_008730 [Proteus mirabilis]MBG2786500.1 hypothetical protein [Proteus mirabilis]MBG5983010.1 hypothetical protein [Proteus mirabilis]MBN7251961.1 hypothetical protein [Proteus mirabilis]MBN7270022.1 hypothetical protein [Proteus mirabilis]
MEQDKFNEKFTKFPYRSDFIDGNKNNGGINLVEHPEKIEEIHEILEYPFMKDILLKINSTDTIFMTFGCDFGVQDNHHCGYIDFSYKSNLIPNDYTKIRNLDSEFYQYLSSLNVPWGEVGTPVDYAKSALYWEYSDLVVYDSQKYEKVSLWMKAREYSALEWLATHFCNFLIAYKS